MAVYERGTGRPRRVEGRALTLGCAPIGPNLIHSPRGQDMVTQHLTDSVRLIVLTFPVDSEGIWI
jgi:hypothetical protein